MNRKRLLQIFWGLIILLFLGGCETTSPILTLTINESKCTFAGTNTIPKGGFSIKLIINEQKLTETGYSLIALEKGKTMEDLRAWRSVDQPPWVIAIEGVHEMIAGNHTYTYDSTTFKQNAAYQGGPLYLMCFRANPDTGMGEVIGGPFGPFEVKK